LGLLIQFYKEYKPKRF